MIIRAPRLTEDVARLQQLILEQKMTPLTFYKDRSEYFVDVSEILFFETDGERSMGIPEKRPMRFVKNSTNWKRSCRLLSVASPSRPSSIQSRFIPSKIFSGTSTVNFYQTHKQVHVSRHYYQLLKERLKEMR